MITPFCTVCFENFCNTFALLPPNSGVQCHHPIRYFYSFTRKDLYLLMNRRIFAFLCSLIILSALLFVDLGVWAEPDTSTAGTTEPTSSTNATDPTDTTSPFETTHTTDTGTTAPQPINEPVFTFSYSPLDIMMTVTYSDMPAGVSVSKYVLNNASVSVTDTGRSFAVNLEALNVLNSPGRYPITFFLSDGSQITPSQAVEVRSVSGDSIELTLSVSVSNGLVSAVLKDQYGKPVPYYPVKLYLSDIYVGVVKNTSQSGNVTFPTRVADDITNIKCVADNHSGRVNYAGTEKSYVRSVATTHNTGVVTTHNTDVNSTDGSTQTPQSTATPVATSAPKSRFIFSALTPVIRGAQTGLGFAYERDIPGLFKCDEPQFSDNSRLYFDTDNYTALVGESTVKIMALAEVSKTEVIDEMILNAISGKSEYSTYHSNETARITLDISLAYANSDMTDVFPIDIPVTDATIEMPIPSYLSDSEKFKVAVALLDESGNFIEYMIPTSTTPEGVLSFVLPHLGTIVLLGFPPPTSYSEGASLPVLIVLFMIIGVLLLASAVFLLYFFFLRRVKSPVLSSDKDD